MAELDLLVIGDCNVDLIAQAVDPLPVYGREKLLADLTLTIGGSGSIMACGAARLGLRTGLLSIVGNDLWGDFMLDELASRGVSTRRVARTPEEKTGATISLTAGHDRALLTHLGTIPGPEPGAVEASWLADARHIHVASYFLLTRLAPGLPDLLAAARRARVTVSLDTGWDPAERWESGLDDVLRQVDVFLPNEGEALAISGQVTVEAALAELAARVPTVVIKLGAMGAIARRGAEQARAQAIPVDVVDTTGAGDSFDAGLIYGLLEGWGLQQALELATVCGGLSTRAAGGTGAQPSLAEARSRLVP
jgi:sugar/nucleoside kinase (ribokinase family)